MQRKRVNSSKLRSVGYDEGTKTLEVEMSNGQVYQYVGVYPEVYRRFMAAPNSRLAAKAAASVERRNIRI